MQVFDIVRIVGPATLTSYPRNSRTLVGHFDDPQQAENVCELYNQCRDVTDCHYQVEEHDELSPDRACPVN